MVQLQFAVLKIELTFDSQHRYYGESMPYGSKEEAYKNSTSLAYLTAEQALADYALLLTELKRQFSAEASPVVLFGGSYGGSKITNLWPVSL